MAAISSIPTQVNIGFLQSYVNHKKLTYNFSFIIYLPNQHCFLKYECKIKNFDIKNIGNIEKTYNDSFLNSLRKVMKLQISLSRFSQMVIDNLEDKELYSAINLLIEPNIFSKVNDLFRNSLNEKNQTTIYTILCFLFTVMDHNNVAQWLNENKQKKTIKKINTVLSFCPILGPYKYKDYFNEDLNCFSFFWTSSGQLIINKKEIGIRNFKCLSTNCIKFSRYS